MTRDFHLPIVLPFSAKLQSSHRTRVSVILARSWLKPHLLTLSIRVPATLDCPIELVLWGWRRGCVVVVVMMLGICVSGGLVAEDAESKVGAGDGAKDQDDCEELQDKLATESDIRRKKTHHGLV